MKRVLILISVFYLTVIIIGCSCTEEYEKWWATFKLENMENINGIQFDKNDTAQKIHFMPRIELLADYKEISSVPINLTKSSYATAECDEEYEQINSIKEINVFLLSDSLDNYKKDDNITDLFLASNTSNKFISIPEMVDAINNSNTYISYNFYLKFDEAPIYEGRFMYEVKIEFSDNNVESKSQNIYLID